MASSWLIVAAALLGSLLAGCAEGPVELNPESAGKEPRDHAPQPPEEPTSQTPESLANPTAQSFGFTFRECKMAQATIQGNPNTFPFQPPTGWQGRADTLRASVAFEVYHCDEILRGSAQVFRQTWLAVLSHGNVTWTNDPGMTSHALYAPIAAFTDNASFVPAIQALGIPEVQAAEFQFDWTDGLIATLATDEGEAVLHFSQVPDGGGSFQSTIWHRPIDGDDQSWFYTDRTAEFSHSYVATTIEATGIGVLGAVSQWAGSTAPAFTGFAAEKASFSAGEKA